MGLGPLNAVAQARFNRYLLHHEIADTSESKVWAFVGDGEMDEPEAMAGLSIAAREQLDNLIFVVNCNLQRLDGPVRGNGKIIQELEAIFRGAGWNVIKVVWGRGWDELLARDVDGVLVNKMNTTVDGEFQKYAVESRRVHPRALLRPRPAAADDGRAPLRRRPAQAAARRARLPQALRRLQDGGRARGQPDRHPRQDGQGVDARRRASRRATRRTRSRSSRADELKAFRDRLQLPIPDSELDDGDPPYCHPGTDSPEYEYMMARRRALDGSVPERVVRSEAGAHAARRQRPYADVLAGTGEKVQASTTTAFARLLRNLLRDPEHRHARRADHPRRGAHVRPRRAVPRRRRSTRRSASATSRSTPSCCCRTARRSNGRILEEGITEAGVDGVVHRRRHRRTRRGASR